MYFQPSEKKQKLSAIEKLFEEEDNEVMEVKVEKALTIQERVYTELAKYRKEQGLLSHDNPIAWWWEHRLLYQALSCVASMYLSIQKSSTPSECIFSTAGDVISQERACLHPAKADKLIFLHKNT